MKLKSSAIGMVLPLTAAVALSTAPAASASPAHSAVQSDQHRGRDDHRCNRGESWDWGHHRCRDNHGHDGRH
jgi:hypothetical protein